MASFTSPGSTSIPAHVQERLGQVSGELALACYIITHDPLSNTRKYADASSVSIALRADEGSRLRRSCRR